MSTTIEKIAAIEHALGVLRIRLDNCTNETEKKKIQEAIVNGEVLISCEKVKEVFPEMFVDDKDSK